MTESPRPPAHVEPYVRALGIDAALDFLLAFGGADLYIPATPNGRSRLVAEIGREGAERLAAIAHTLPKRVPTAKPWIAQVLASRGLPKADIARKLHSSDVSVRRWLSGHHSPRDENDRQLRLF
ncbi:hypothetical protein [Rhodobacter maris]|uniref:Uncharacterized protein n=1 Tax=Rhodobacter maris TaxID=446682 RepID=A0A285TCK7_9RHOB|nr:hypothetical protein [Rhodobacter maris]SOC19551.1 hypothetical protein SAMN05877831_11810 [Rhodobacter maris]